MNTQFYTSVIITTIIVFVVIIILSTIYNTFSSVSRPFDNQIMYEIEMLKNKNMMLEKYGFVLRII